MRFSQWCRLRPQHVLVVALMLFLSACATTEPAPRPPTDPDDPSRGPVTRTVDGFRIQIGMSNDQDEADALAAVAAQWYQGLPPSERPAYLGGGDLDVHVAWRAPYYRVQVGRFATRAEADRALSVVSQRFPEAFPVPSTVTVTR